MLRDICAGNRGRWELRAQLSIPAPAAKPAPAKKEAPVAKAAPVETQSILAAARQGAKPGPVSKAEAQSKAVPDAKKAKAKEAIVVPPMPVKPDYAKPRAEKANKEQIAERRAFIFGMSALAIGFAALTATTPASATATRAVHLKRLRCTVLTSSVSSRGASHTRRIRRLLDSMAPRPWAGVLGRRQRPAKCGVNSAGECDARADGLADRNLRARHPAVIDERGLGETASLEFHVEYAATGRRCVVTPHASRKDIPGNCVGQFAIDGVARDVLQQQLRLDAAMAHGGGRLEVVEPLVQIVGAARAAERGLVVGPERDAPAAVVDDVEIDADTALPVEPLVGGEQRGLLRVHADADDELVDEPAGALDDVGMAEGHGVERAGGEADAHAGQTLRVRRWADPTNHIQCARPGSSDNSADTASDGGQTRRVDPN